MSNAAFRRAAFFILSSGLIWVVALSTPLSSAGAAQRQEARSASVPSPTPTPYPQTMYVTSYGTGTNGGVYSYDGDNPGGASNFYSIPAAYSVAVDDAQDLYVGQMPNLPQNGPDVEEFYPSGNGFPYYNDIVAPYAIAVGSASGGFLDVANNNDFPSQGDFGLLSFPQGVNQPSEFADPNLLYVEAVTIDAASNGYIGGVTFARGPEVDLLETNVGTFNLGLHLKGIPQGLLLDSAGNLLVDEGTAIEVFPPGETSPTGTIDWAGGRQAPLAMSFGNGGHWLYVLDSRRVCQGQNCAMRVLVYSYPQVLRGSTVRFSESPYFVQTTSTGVAISPRVPLFDPSSMRRRVRGFKDWADFARERASFRIPGSH